MSHRIRARITYPHVVATLALVVAVAGGSLAIGQSTTATTTILACVRTHGGAVRLVTKPKCRKSRERLVAWNQPGAPGAHGGPRAAGAIGPPGPPGTDSQLPASLVAYFDASSCPSGWTAYEPARGRYLVGVPTGGTLDSVVGTALSDQENRPTGRHNHAITDPGHAHDIGVRTDVNAGNVPVNSIQANGAGAQVGVVGHTVSATTGITVNDSSGASGVAGTNAPYLQLLACRKD